MKIASNATIVSQSLGTVKVEHTTAQQIRCTARQDMPAYGIKAGETFYLTRSSKDNGEYYVTRFDTDGARWQCSCPSHKPCRHMKAVNAVLAIRRAAIQAKPAQVVVDAERIIAEKQTRDAMSRYQYGYHD